MEASDPKPAPTCPKNWIEGDPLVCPDCGCAADDETFTELMIIFPCGTEIVTDEDDVQTVIQSNECLLAVNDALRSANAALEARVAEAEAAERFAGRVLAALNEFGSTAGDADTCMCELGDMAMNAGFLCEPPEWNLTPTGAALAARAKETR